MMTTVFSVMRPALAGAEALQSHPCSCAGRAACLGRPCRGVTFPALSAHVFQQLALIYRETFMMLCPGMAERHLLFPLPGSIGAVGIPELQIAKNWC